MRSFLACLLPLAGCTVGVPARTPRCVDGQVVLGELLLDDCERMGMRCEDAACVGCRPGVARCDGDRVMRCDGAAWIEESACDAPGQGCSAGRCATLCEIAAEDASYLGCEYRAVTTLNSLLPDGFLLGIVVANPGEGPAHVEVTRGELLASVELMPGTSQAISVPLVPELGRAASRSVLLSDGAYVVRSDRPIAAYQYDPLEFRRSPDCVLTGTAADRGCFSFTNDASLLLPIHVLGTEHLVETRGGRSASPSSFVSVTAIERTAVTVRAPVPLMPSEDAAADRALAAWPEDEPRTVQLEAGDVLQLVSTEGDLAGAEILSDRPVQVIAGHDCANVPERFAACDHLEEIMLPVDTWGRTAAVALPRSSDDEPVVVRIVSAIDGNQITITPPGRTFTLDRGERFERTATEDLLVEGTGPLLVAEYLVGAAMFDRGGGRGDPSMGLAPYAEQFRERYDFAVPPSYTDDFAAIVAPEGGVVRLDGEPIVDWSPLPPFRVARVRLRPGAHRLEATDGAGLTLYGIAPFTSYLLPGGLDVEPLR